ncbi:hypothetical protein STENM223S_09196 [Streptomyces tendae]
MHRQLPGVRVQAFLGDVLATGGPEGMRLEKAATRTDVVDSARQVLDAGYDGVHLDLEPLHSGDRNYLSLLDDVRAVTRARDAQLSVAAHQIDPLPGFHSFWGTVAGHPKWWSQAFFGQVARRVDQIAVMSYDTMQPLESLYGGYVAQQTSLALEATPPTTHLLMGLPFYHENRFGHWNHAETVAAAVRGVRLGLSRADAGRERFGVAAYIDFAATEEDWTSYRDGWVALGPALRPAAPDLRPQPHQRVVLAVHGPFLQRDQRVVRDPDPLGTDLGAALGDVAVAEAVVVLGGAGAVQAGVTGGVQRVHVQLGDAHEEARAREGGLVLLVVAHHVAGVLAQEALDALAELLRAVHVLLHHPVLAGTEVGGRHEGRDLAGLGVVEADVRDQVPDHREGTQRRDGDVSSRVKTDMRVMHSSRGRPLTSAEHEPHLPALQFQRTARSGAWVAWRRWMMSRTTSPSFTSTRKSSRPPPSTSPRHTLKRAS